MLLALNQLLVFRERIEPLIIGPDTLREGNPADGESKTSRARVASPLEVLSIDLFQLASSCQEHLTIDPVSYTLLRSSLVDGKTCG